MEDLLPWDVYHGKEFSSLSFLVGNAWVVGGVRVSGVDIGRGSQSLVSNDTNIGDETSGTESRPVEDLTFLDRVRRKGRRRGTRRMKEGKRGPPDGRHRRLYVRTEDLHTSDRPQRRQ